MLMTIYDRDMNMENTVCLHILFALFNLMNKSKLVKTKEDVMSLITQSRDSTILFEANQLDEKLADKESQDKR